MFVMLAISNLNENCNACYFKIDEKGAFGNMGKKDFTKSAITENLAAMFAAGEEAQGEKKETPKKQKPAKKKQGAAEQEGQIIPPGYVLKKESKSERTSILFRPSTLKGLREAAEEEGKSFNELCNSIFENYLAERRAKK